MQLLPLSPLFVAAAVVAVIAFDRMDRTANNATTGHDLFSQEISQSDKVVLDSLSPEEPWTHPQADDLQHPETELLVGIEAYEDADYGFSVAIPSGWQKIVAAESEESFAELEPGYAVGFESPYQGEHDKFADYILIEVLPGKDSGLFETDGKNRRKISIDGQVTWMDKLDVEGESGGLTEVDLTIYQAQTSGLGYTIGFYSIGEPSRQKLMSDAFELIVRTFKQTTSPFPTS